MNRVDQHILDVCSAPLPKVGGITPLSPAEAEDLKFFRAELSRFTNMNLLIQASLLAVVLSALLFLLLDMSSANGGWILLPFICINAYAVFRIARLIVRWIKMIPVYVLLQDFMTKAGEPHLYKDMRSHAIARRFLSLAPYFGARSRK